MMLLILFYISVCFSGAVLEQTCKYHDLVENLNLTKQHDLLSQTIPRKDWKKPLTIIVDAKVISMSVVARKKSMTNYIWFSAMWKNEFVTWNPGDFCNISSITLPLSHFWVPDLYIYEQILEDTASWMPYANITSDGMITATKPAQFTVTCALDMYYFPFDVQMCKMTIISFIHLANDIILKPSKNSSEMLIDSKHFLLDFGDWEFCNILVEQNITDRRSQIIYSVLSAKIVHAALNGHNGHSPFAPTLEFLYCLHAPPLLNTLKYVIFKYF
ncbi:5-hydroxytryptamine receptor 3A-like [Spea bombifrons]|uniref:5-hydroxytryptamine receptor 3A-like n=1 Tax=Spea bombifrons TaxID=233779 RepID=UPI002349F7C4|nr:5-hydroxytryptamine receptor 3A-like [Spea bombifrons]